MEKICIITANMGKFDKEFQYVEQSIKFDFYQFTDSNFPPRYCAMTPRMQARIPKCFSWQMIPNYDIYIWVDSSMAITNKDTVKWFLDQLSDEDAAFFKHPDRNTIREEADFIKRKIQEKNYYLTPRYSNELIDEELKEILSTNYPLNSPLIASTAFVYHNSIDMQDMLKEWWYHISRYHIVDQLGLPYCLWKYDINYNLINAHYMRTPYLEYVRNKK
jgi:hypothetical protein